MSELKEEVIKVCVEMIYHLSRAYEAWFSFAHGMVRCWVNTIISFISTHFSVHVGFKAENDKVYISLNV